MNPRPVLVVNAAVLCVTLTAEARAQTAPSPPPLSHGAPTSPQAYPPASSTEEMRSKGLVAGGAVVLACGLAGVAGGAVYFEQGGELPEAVGAGSIVLGMTHTLAGLAMITVGSETRKASGDAAVQRLPAVALGPRSARLAWSF